MTAGTATAYIGGRRWDADGGVTLPSVNPANGGDHFARPLMEFGGKVPNIVFADADMSAAVRGSTWGIFHNAGQICVASSRLLVQESVAGRVVDALARQTANGYDVLEELTQTKRVSVNYAGAGPARAGLDEDGTG